MSFLQVIDPATTAAALAAVKEYLDDVVKPLLKEAGGLLSDRVEEWRLKNRLNSLLRMKAFMEARGLKPAAVLPDIFLNALEESGKTSDETLSDMFASLLIGSFDPEEESTSHPSYAHTLAEMSPLDAKVLLVIALAQDIREELVKAKEQPGTVNDNVLAFCLDTKPDKLRRRLGNATVNLKRLDLIADNRDTGPVVGMIQWSVGTDRPAWIVTKFGRLFLQAVSRIDPPQIVEREHVRGVLLADERLRQQERGIPWA